MASDNATNKAPTAEEIKAEWDAKMKATKRTVLDADFIGEVKIEEIYIKPGFNPRKSRNPSADQEFEHDVRLHGVLQPIIIGRNSKAEKWHVVAGHRRFEAATKAGLNKIKAVGYTADNATLAEIAITENIAREDLTSYDLAVSIETFTLNQPKGTTQAEIAARFAHVNGKAYGRTSITMYLGYLHKLSAGALALWAQDRLTTRDLSRLSAMPKDEQEKELATPEGKVTPRTVPGKKDKIQKSRPVIEIKAAMKAVKGSRANDAVKAQILAAMKWCANGVKELKIGDVVVFPIPETDTDD